MPRRLSFALAFTLLLVPFTSRQRRSTPHRSVTGPGARWTFLYTSGQIALVDSGGTPITPEVTINGYASIGSLDVGFGGALGVVPEFANQVAQGFAVTMSTGSSQPILLGYSLSSVDFLGAGSSLSAPEPGGVGLIAVLLATLLKLRR